MTHRILVAPLAIEDLIALHRWIASNADQAVADHYLGRIEARITSLSTFPERGTPRTDLGADIRTLTFERRLILAYRVGEGDVTVLRVIDAARDLGEAFGAAGDG